MNHSWFHRIRRLLETGVTITLPFGTFTFEPDAQAGVFVLLHLQRYSFLLYQTLLTISILFFYLFLTHKINSTKIFINSYPNCVETIRFNILIQLSLSI